MIKYIFLFVEILVSHIILGQQNNIQVTQKDTLFLAGKQINYFPDSTGRMTIDDILNPELQQRFKKNKKNIFSTSPQSTAFWFKITVTNHSNEDIWLEAGGLSAARIDFYYPDENNRYHPPILTGSLRPDENKFIDSNMIWLPLNKAGETGPKTYYVRAVALTVVQYPFYIGTLHQLYKKKTLDDFIVAGFIGFIISMLLYNLFLYAKTRERSNLYYLGYLLSSLLLYPYIYDHETLKYIFPFIPFEWWSFHFSFIGAPPYLFIGLFGIEYLKLRKELSNATKIISALLVLLFIITFLNLITPSYNIMLPAQAIISILGITCMSSSIVLFMRKKDLRSLYYMIGWSAFIIMNIIFILGVNGVMDYNLFTHNSLLFGTILEVVIFSQALAQQVKNIRIENSLIQEQSFELIKNHNSILEKKVEERTTVIQNQKKKLEVQAQKLEVTNQTKDKLFAIISHDLRNPIISLETIMNLLCNNAISDEEFKSLTEGLHKNVKSINFTLNNLLHWANKQIKGIKATPQKFNISNVIDENISLFRCIADEKQIIITHETKNDNWVYADQDQINLVVRNLLNNAIKFSEEGGHIIINSSAFDSQFLMVEIVDDGIGIKKDTLNKLFNTEDHCTSRGTKGEKGTGLGLMLCKDFVESNGGMINVYSEPGEGARFYFTVRSFVSEKEEVIEYTH